jgi:toxin-antitoxin system PIN domain toxin
VSTRWLLDVNVLVALFDPDHVHHDIAHDWFAEHRSAGWATCPTTENGLIRVVANPAYGSPDLRAAELVDSLRRFCASGGHQFWPDGPSLRDRAVFAVDCLAGYRQITDAYLLAVARAHGGRLATFDRGIPIRAVIGATARDLAVLSAAG